MQRRELTPQVVLCRPQARHGPRGPPLQNKYMSEKLKEILYLLLLFFIEFFALCFIEFFIHVNKAS